MTSSSISYRDAGRHTVKGKTEPLPLWRAERVVAGVGGTHQQDGFEGALVGRDSELRLIKDLFHAGVDRRVARLVEVTGPAGVGKTRLRWEFDKYVDGLASDHLWHYGRCLSYGDGVAYWALAEMVRQRFGIPQDATVSGCSRARPGAVPPACLTPSRSWAAPAPASATPAAGRPSGPARSITSGIRGRSPRPAVRGRTTARSRI